jgi:hypothetical protein
MMQAAQAPRLCLCGDKVYEGTYKPYVGSRRMMGKCVIGDKVYEGTRRMRVQRAQVLVVIRKF